MVKRRLVTQLQRGLLIMLAVMLSGLGQFSLHASALTTNQTTVLSSGIYVFNTEAGNATCGGVGTTVTSFGYGSASKTASLPKSIGEITTTPSTDTNASDANGKIVYQYLIGKGLTPNQVAGLLGNLHYEAHFRADEAGESPWPLGGFGIVQWTAGRRLNIVSAMNAAGIGDLYNQAWDQDKKAGHTPADKAGILLGFELDYMWYELNHNYKDRVLVPLKNAVTYQDATKVVYDYYEGLKGSNDPSFTSRLDNALKDLQKYNGLAALAGGGSACGTNLSAGWDLTGSHAMVIYDQYDPAYARQPFGRGTIQECGCGPTSMAMAIATLTGDKTVTPPVVAAYYAAHGGQVGAPGCASTWKWSVLSNQWPGIQVVDIGPNLQRATDTIKAGGLVLVSYSGGPFTSNTPDPKTGQLPGHIFLIRGVADDGSFYIANTLNSFAGKAWATQNTTAWPLKDFSTAPNDTGGPGKGGNLVNMWAITKVTKP